MGQRHITDGINVFRVDPHFPQVMRKVSPAGRQVSSKRVHLPILEFLDQTAPKGD